MDSSYLITKKKNMKKILYFIICITSIKNSYPYSTYKPYIYIQAGYNNTHITSGPFRQSDLYNTQFSYNHNASLPECTLGTYIEINPHSSYSKENNFFLKTGIEASITPKRSIIGNISYQQVESYDWIESDYIVKHTLQYVTINPYLAGVFYFTENSSFHFSLGYRTCVTSPLKGLNVYQKTDPEISTGIHMNIHPHRSYGPTCSLSFCTTFNDSLYSHNGEPLFGITYHYSYIQQKHSERKVICDTPDTQAPFFIQNLITLNDIADASIIHSFQHTLHSHRISLSISVMLE